MTGVTTAPKTNTISMEIRVRGTVQGVGFRPMVWWLAHECRLTGNVRNDGAGVLIHVSGLTNDVSDFLIRLEQEAPPLCQIDHIETEIKKTEYTGQSFNIVESRYGEPRTQVTPDAATCLVCRQEVLNPKERRFRYPFTNCTNCGPRFSIIEGVPYDRSHTTMKVFEMCEDCRSEYLDPSDRRFHAQPIACHKCGPRTWLERMDGEVFSHQQQGQLDDAEAVAGLLERGNIIAIRGVGGFHLACDAINAEAVKRLRDRKKRYGKPFALMARDIDIIKSYCLVSELERELLESPEAPIVLLSKSGKKKISEFVAPGMNTLGFMLPYTPIHNLMLEHIDHPIVMTSGNLSSEPQVTMNDEARDKLGTIADYALFHDREIANRIDDSVVRVMDGAPRLLRRSRGYAPGSISLPAGFEAAPEILAYGAELKSTFCMIKDGSAILSQHQGDLEDPATLDDYQKNISLYKDLYDLDPDILAADKHPEYLSTKLAKEVAASDELKLVQVQHHHAHIASCMAENGKALDADPVLGVTLDGLGYGDDGTIWGGEFLLTDYMDFDRLGMFKPVAMLGGEQAIYEPWRNTYAHLVAGIGWQQFSENFSNLELFGFLNDKPRDTLDQMLRNNINVPLASSCGRLFDAVATAVGLCQEMVFYEGQAAMELEAIVDVAAWQNIDDALAYPFSITNNQGNNTAIIDPEPMWNELLDDLMKKTPIPLMAARFHKGLAIVITQMVEHLATKHENNGVHIDTIALSGGCFQNRLLLEEVNERLSEKCYEVITQARAPANDGGIALGQAAIVAARHIHGQDGREGI